MDLPYKWGRKFYLTVETFYLSHGVEKATIRAYDSMMFVTVVCVFFNKFV